MVNKTVIGCMGEEVASQYLFNKGYEILERNYRLSFAEIDIIALNSDYIIFVEVKLRNNLNYGYPREAVTKHKQVKIRRAAEVFIAERDPLCEERNLRFDVIEVLRLNGGVKIEHLENAF